jgi:hypothetical protein
MCTSCAITGTRWANFFTAAQVFALNICPAALSFFKKIIRLSKIKVLSKKKKQSKLFRASRRGPQEWGPAPLRP